MRRLFLRHCKIVFKWFTPAIALILCVNFIANETGEYWLHYANYLILGCAIYFGLNEARPVNKELHDFFVRKEEDRSESIRRQHNMPIQDFDRKEDK